MADVNSLPQSTVDRILKLLRFAYLASDREFSHFNKCSECLESSTTSEESWCPDYRLLKSYYDCFTDVAVSLASGGTEPTPERTDADIEHLIEFVKNEDKGVRN